MISNLIDTGLRSIEGMRSCAFSLNDVTINLKEKSLSKYTKIEAREKRC